MDKLISYNAAIDADGLDEEIRCEMCENPMHTDRGCDGNCKYDEILYEKIIQILNKRITPLPSAQPEIIRCCKCGFWDRDTLRHQFNDFRDWNEAECMILAERDPYHEMDRYTEADDFCSFAERREE